MNLHVFFAVLEIKLNQNNKTLQNFHLWGCKAAALALLYNFFFSFVRKKSLIMQKIWMLASYVDPHHCILLDTLSWHP